MIIALLVLWFFLGLGAGVVFGACTQRAESERQFERELHALGRCHRRVTRQFDPAAGANPAARANTSAGVSSGAARRG